MNLKKAYKDGITILEEAGIPEAANDAKIFLTEALGVDYGYILAHIDDELPEDEYKEKLAIYFANLDRRAGRIPLQHILGHTYFMGLKFKVNENALIPRPDTEILVEEVLKYIHDGMEVLDVCTGSGCILTSLLYYTNYVKGTGTDISEEALALAKENSDMLLKDKEGTEYKYIKSDIYDSVEGMFDIIVSNPPYIKSSVIPGLEPEVKDHDPLNALDGGEDGLIFYRRLIAEAGKHLKMAGRIFLEIGYDQAKEVSELLKENDFTDIEVIKDYQDNDRVVTAGRKICLTN